VSIILFLLSDSPASEFCVPTFRNTYIFMGRLKKKKTTTTNTCLCIRHLPNSGSTLRQSHVTTDGRSVGRSCGALRPRCASVWRQKSPPPSVVHYLHIHICMFRLGLCTHFSVLTTTVFTTVYTIQYTHTHTHTHMAYS